MQNETCYLCEQILPEGQSFYEDHGVKVCLSCFRDTARCKKCKFPSQQLEAYPGIGAICEFCRAQVQDTGMSCYLCTKKIPSWMSHYSDHDHYVCQECFADADRCFLCRFPHSIKYIPNFGHICEFCVDNLIKEGDDLSSFFTPLESFLKQHKQQMPKNPVFKWVNWNLLIGMQVKDAPNVKIKYLDEFLHFAYPIFYLKGNIFVIQQIPLEYFLPHLAGQFAAADLCAQYSRPHLLGDSPFDQYARGWCHWISYSTARILKYEKVQKQLSRWPEQFQDQFQKFQAMSEYRKSKEIINFAQGTLGEYARKYL